ncbi:hypothetical protein MKW92_030045 [Papaver armeniacum]|nr:hypothetical protein MKW92_030045 [Papaver armeniacum]
MEFSVKKSHYSETCYLDLQERIQVCKANYFRIESEYDDTLKMLLMVQGQALMFELFGWDNHLKAHVLDGHGGKHAAHSALNNLPRPILEDEDFLKETERAVASAFLQADSALAEACSTDAALAPGATALTAVVIGR